MNPENTETQQKENKLGVMPIGKLLAVMSIPTMFSMLIQALYNIVDSIFVSRVSEKALTAVSLAFPMQMLMTAFAVGISVGICSVISRRLGEKKNDLANLSAQTGYTILLIVSAAFILIGLFLSKQFVLLFTDDPELILFTTQYLRICLGLSLGIFMSILSEKVLQGTGDTMHPMIIQSCGAITNIILDPIFIFGYFGLPALGIRGAAIATVTGQFVSMFLGHHFLSKSKAIKIKFSKIKYDKECAKDIFQVGVPSVIMQGIGTIMTSSMNAILISYDILATTVFGVYFKLQSFVFMPVFGLNSGVMPIIGYNYGAKNKERMMKALRMGIIIAIIIMTIGTLVFSLFPDTLLGFFNASDNMLAIGRIALRRISLSFPAAAFCIMIGSIFQAVGAGYVSMITSSVRQLGVLIPCAWLFGRLFGLDAIWFAFAFAEIFAITLNIIFFMKERKKWQFED